MKLAISNIAWQEATSDEARNLLVGHGVNGIEVAPGKVSSSPSQVSENEITRFLSFWSEKNIHPVAFQALLFGQSELRVFGDDEQEQEFISYMDKIITLAGKMAAGALVFGSPKNRQIGDFSESEILEKSKRIFSRLGETCVANNCRLGLEANPVDYSCNFATNLTEAYAVVRSVNHPGFALHIDTSSMFMNNESPEMIKKLSPREISHVHLSEPFLAPVSPSGQVQQKKYLQALAEIGYEGWVSIEMKPLGEEKDNLTAVDTSLSFVTGILESILR